MPGCNGRDRGCNITLPERVQTSVWSFFAREFEKYLKGVKQMNRKLCATPRVGQHWQDIDFANAEKCVKKLQMRIAKAVKERKWGKVKALQWTLTHSYYAKVLAVKQVAENRGKRTSGVDHELWDTPDGKLKAIGKLKRHGYRPLPLRRVYIPKKNGKLRPLSIPTMTDRAMQTLYRFALDPVAETMADAHSYGFRKGCCVQDAIEHCFTSLSRGTSPAWILEGDIKGCFDHISHKWLLDNIPMDKEILGKFLKSGFVDGGIFHNSEEGTPQGGTISTVLCNMTLDGLEPLLKERFVRKYRNGRMYNPKVNFTRYADDFIVTGESPELLDEQVKPLIRQFLQERGLTLSEEKTKITHIEDGFDFLGCNIRKFKGKLLTRPSKTSEKAFLAKIRAVIRANRMACQQDLIAKLNPIIRGWTNFHRFNVASRVFHHADFQIYQALWKWAKRRHPNKGSRWIAQRYFHRIGNRTWTFSVQWRRTDGSTGYYALEYASDVKIARYPKIQDGANPYDEEWQLYFEERETDKMRISVKGNATLRKIFRIQKGRCALCGERLTLETGARCHKYTDGMRTMNYLVHPNCHRKIHSFPLLRPAYCGSNRL